MAILIVSAISE